MGQDVFTARTEHEFIERLEAEVKPQLDKGEHKGFASFIRLFFHRYSFDDLAGRCWSDLAVWALYLWRFSGAAEALPRVEIISPESSSQALGCPHTILLVHQKDMPFLVDSVRIELSARNIPIYSLKSMPYSVSHTAAGEVLLTAVSECSDNSQALMYLEIGYDADNLNNNGLIEALTAVLAQVDKVVGAYAQLRERTLLLADNLAAAQANIHFQHVVETQDFLHWLVDDHFIFLGYSEFTLGERNGKKTLIEDKARRLGLFDNQTTTRVKTLGETGGVARFYLSPMVAAFSKSPERSRVHRHAYPDYVVVKRFNTEGELIGEARILGLYTSAVYSVSPLNIPLVCDKLHQVYERMGINLRSHEGKALSQVVENFPRDELFQAGTAELYETFSGILAINERYQVRLFLRVDRFGKFVSALIYIPRDVFSTRVREQIQSYLADYLGADDQEFTTWFSESVLARVHLVFRIKKTQSKKLDDKRTLENHIAALVKPWRHKLHDVLIAKKGEGIGRRYYQRYRKAFPDAYQANYNVNEAFADIDHIQKTDSDSPVFINIAEGDSRNLNMRFFSRGRCLELSDVIPVVENMGFRVIAEHPFVISPKDEDELWLHDFHLQSQHRFTLTEDLSGHIQAAFLAVWQGRISNDNFNGLIVGAGLNWQQAEMLRAYAAYMRQIEFAFTPAYMAETLGKHVAITDHLVSYFECKFSLEKADNDALDETLAEHEQAIMTALDAVENLNEDRILRQFLVLIKATKRCNYYQRRQQDFPGYLCFKLTPRAIAGVPEPRPLYEIYVSSARFEGVHLRGARVARGGLRWSDRLQDYRTEVLGLVKAQQVKNAVIVPSGAKGGFVCKQLTGLDRDAFRQEGIACYRLFIRALLDLTDNIKAGEIIPAVDVRRHDDDDPYLVVAADKGTATFSDTANGIAREYDFWLDDAFASGGSQGYDHKAMGITARGAWVSVERLFMERGVDISCTPFSVIGIGDMGGDVFGNGMLLSRAIKLVAAFNHLHIFIDPNPDPEQSFAERQRLFGADQSGWDAYNKELISTGGGVFSRAAKSIAITAQMKECFAISESHLTPNEFIHRLLQASVDLLWNGGIGTYVKASGENHAEVGDKANDSLRVDGKQLSCKVIGEGGNLGMTQRGRIEYAQAGGACNTDFIDNAAGVDCSDHEVNIKILLGEQVKAGELNEAARNQLLVEMTDAVAALVLKNNYRQTQAISLARADTHTTRAEYRRFMTYMEAGGRLDRRLEFLPDDETLNERNGSDCVLTRPEISVLLAYAKMELKELLATDEIAEMPVMVRYCHSAFPALLVEKYPDALGQHRLRKEIIATELANHMVNAMGCTFVQRLSDATGADAPAIARAFIFAHEVFAANQYQEQLEALDYKLPANLQLQLMNRLAATVKRGARWFLRNYRQVSNLDEMLALYRENVQQVRQSLPEVLNQQARSAYQTQLQTAEHESVAPELLRAIIAPGELYTGLSVADIALREKANVADVTALYVTLVECLNLDVFAAGLTSLAAENYWQSLARESFMDDLESQAKTLTQLLLPAINTTPVTEVVDQWAAQHEALIRRWQTMVSTAQATAGGDYALYAMALRELLDLVQVSRHSTPIEN